MKTPITIRVEAELLTEVRRCARQENRTLTNFIETVLRQRLAEPARAVAAARAGAPLPPPDKNEVTHVA